MSVVALNEMTVDKWNYPDEYPIQMFKLNGLCHDILQTVDYQLDIKIRASIYRSFDAHIEWIVSRYYKSVDYKLNIKIVNVHTAVSKIRR